MKQTRKNVSPMSNEGRNSYVIEHLTDALLELLAQKPLEDISISELVEKAGVGRVSFYRNFERKEDIIKAHMDALFREWAETAEQNNHAPLSEQVRIMIAHFETHRDFYSIVNKQGLIWLVKDSIIGLCGPKPEYNMMDAYTSAFAAYTLYGWIDTWFQRGMKESADEIAEMFRERGL